MSGKSGDIVENPSKTVAELNDEFHMELAKESFLSIMEAVWPAVATYYFEVEREIFSSIRSIGLELKERAAVSEKGENCSQQTQVDLFRHGSSSELDGIKPDESGSKVETLALTQAKSTTRKIFQIKGENGNITWDVIGGSVPNGEDENENGGVKEIVMGLKKSEPIIVKADPINSFYFESPPQIPANLRQAITDAEAQVREILSSCFGKTLKFIITGYPKLRWVINKAYPQICHMVGCSYPNIQCTLNSAYDKVQSTVKSSYPRIRRTVSCSFPKRQTVTLSYRRYRQHKHGGRMDANLATKLFRDANQEMENRLAEAHAEVNQALQTASKKISVALGNANLEVLQSLKVASSRVTKSLMKANSEMLEALANANDDLRKSIALVHNEAFRALQSVKSDLSENLREGLPPTVTGTILHSFDDLQGALAECHMELLETVANAGADVCEQITHAHGRYSGAKVNVNHEISLALAKANSQVLQVLIGANSKVTETLERNCERFKGMIGSLKAGCNPDSLETKVWRLIERCESETWRAAECASLTVESAVENTDGRLWKIADEADHNLRKAVQTVEQKLMAVIASSEWNLKTCAERLEQQVAEKVVQMKENAWKIVAAYMDNELLATTIGVKLFQGEDIDSSKPAVSKSKLHRSASIEVLLHVGNEYSVDFPEEDSEEDVDFKRIKDQCLKKLSDDEKNHVLNQLEGSDTDIQVKSKNQDEDTNGCDMPSIMDIKLSSCSARTRLDSAGDKFLTTSKVIDEPADQKTITSTELSDTELMAAVEANLDDSGVAVGEIETMAKEENSLNDAKPEAETEEVLEYRLSESNMTEPFEDDRSVQSSPEELLIDQDADRISEISDFTLNPSNVYLPGFDDDSTKDCGRPTSSCSDEPVRKRKRYSDSTDHPILPGLKDCLVKCAKEIFGLPDGNFDEENLHGTSSGYEICRSIVIDEVRGTLELEAFQDTTNTTDEVGFTDQCRCEDINSVVQDSFEQEKCQSDEKFVQPLLTPTNEDLLEFRPTENGTILDAYSDPAPEPLPGTVQLHEPACKEALSELILTEPVGIVENTLYPHTLDPPPSLIELTTKFRENLRKLKNAVSSSSGNSSEVLISTTAEATKILQECQSAWDALTSIHGQSEDPSPVETPNQNSTYANLPSHLLKLNSTSEGVETANQDHQFPRHGCLEDGLSSTNPTNTKPCVNETAFLWEADSIFSTIHWEIIESVTGEFQRHSSLESGGGSTIKNSSSTSYLESNSSRRSTPSHTSINRAVSADGDDYELHVNNSEVHTMSINSPGCVATVALDVNNNFLRASPQESPLTPPSEVVKETPDESRSFEPLQSSGSAEGMVGKMEIVQAERKSVDKLINSPRAPAESECTFNTQPSVEPAQLQELIPGLVKLHMSLVNVTHPHPYPLHSVARPNHKVQSEVSLPASSHNSSSNSNDNLHNPRGQGPQCNVLHMSRSPSRMRTILLQTRRLGTHIRRKISLRRPRNVMSSIRKLVPCLQTEDSKLPGSSKVKLKFPHGHSRKTLHSAKGRRRGVVSK